MKLQEQLDELRNNILRDQSDLVAGDRDALWSDDTLLRYIKNAEWRFARDTFVLRDGTSPLVTRITLRDGVSTYPLHKSVLGVLSARLGLHAPDLQRTNHGIVHTIRAPQWTAYDPLQNYDLPPGKPVAYLTDETSVFASQGGVNLTVYPHPDATQDGHVIHMRVVRRPICGYSVEKDLNRDSEYDDDFALELLEYAAFLAQRTFDADAGAPTSSVDHKKMYDELVARTKKAMLVNAAAFMGVQYGMNGFTWVR